MPICLVDLRYHVKEQVVSSGGEGDVSTFAIPAISIDGTVRSGKLFPTAISVLVIRNVSMYPSFSLVISQEVLRVNLCLLVSHISLAVLEASVERVLCSVVQGYVCLLQTHNGDGSPSRPGT